MSATTSGFPSRLWRVPVVIILCLIVAGIYLVRTQPIYTATAILRIQNPDQRQTDAIRAQAAHVEDPTGKLNNNLRVEIVPESQLLRISLDGDDPRLTAQLINRVIDAYVNRPPVQAPTTTSSDPELKRAATALAEFKPNNPLPSPEQEKALRDRLATLTAAITSAQIEAAAAKATLDATVTMLADPAKAANLIEASRSKGIFDSLDRETRQIQAELSGATDLLEQQKKTMLAQNPTRLASEKTVAEIQDRLAAQQKRYVEVYRTVLEQQWQTAHRKQEDLQRLADEQREALQATEAKITRLHELQAKLDEAKAAVARARGEPPASDAPVQIVKAAEVPTKPAWPDRTRVMWIALACGIVAGLLASLIRVGDA